MYYTILHESDRRLRIRLARQRLTLREADVLEYYLADLADVEKAGVNERTGEAFPARPGPRCSCRGEERALYSGGTAGRP